VLPPPPLSSFFTNSGEGKTNEKGITVTVNKE
jgi:hypothetical protein